MKYTKVPADGFKRMQMNAGVVLSDFSPETATIDRSKILGMTSGGITFQASPTFKDRADGIDNVPKNTKEFMQLESIDAKLTATFVSIDKKFAKFLAACADVAGDKITPRADIDENDFLDIWLVGDYSDDNSDQSGGYIAIHMMNVLSTGGFQIKTTDEGNGQFSATLTAHYSIENMDVVPYEIYIHGDEEDGE